MGRTTKRIFVFGVSMVFLIGMMGAADVQGAAASGYPEKNITFEVPTPPGGSYDTVSRLLATFLEKYLPRKVNIVILNKPGASMDIGISYLWRSKPDGYTLGIFNLPGNAVNQVMGRARWDLTKMTWIGNVTSTPQMGAVSDKSRYKSFKDLLEAKHVFKVATVGINTVAGLATAVTAETLHMKMKPVVHDGGRAAVTAALRGDVDYVQLAYPILIKFAGKGITPVIVFADKPSRGLPGVPTIKDFGHEDLLDVTTSRFVVGAPPGVPPKIAGILREAFNKACKDPEFIAKIEKFTKYEMRPLDYIGAEKIVKNSLRAVEKYKPLIERLSK